ncbi:hypothetical protein NADFUDRAFT_46725 [Nadsonia fulvescens var. elongata DSM 6958]|uniref:Guanine nucleotide-exchange factor SEC12 n=1 Tax=Nadsonia fulvescens var. elongata DSM 6958 TaxID=857566 RepID=A0A1E3PHK5_9ASCO|nr:hypothetical protein NADFUDRAFT_46725 [Nadsonia fulvescens var. elongata DSM 6958]
MSDHTTNNPDSLDLGYPLFAAAFWKDTKLVVAGGGGEGKNGIANKISLIDISLDTKSDSKSLTIASDLTLDKRQDNPTSIDITNEGQIIAGINNNQSDIKLGINHHYRTYQIKDNQLSDEFSESLQFFDAKDNEEYQKCTSINSEAGLVAISSSANPGVIYLIKLADNHLVFKIALDGGDINDLSFSNNGKYVSFVTDSSLGLISIETESIVKSVLGPREVRLNKVRFSSIDQELIVGGNHPRRTGFSLYKYNLDGKLIASKKISSSKASMTALDTKNNLIGLAGSNLTLYIVCLDNLKTVYSVKEVHNFPITKVVFNTSGTILASVSAGNTLHIVRIPVDERFHKNRESFLWTALSLAVVVSVAILFNLLIKYQIADDLLRKLPTTLKSNLLLSNENSASFIEAEKPTLLTSSLVSFKSRSTKFKFYEPTPEVIVINDDKSENTWSINDQIGLTSISSVIGSTVNSALEPTAAIADAVEAIEEVAQEVAKDLEEKVKATQESTPIFARAIEKTAEKVYDGSEAEKSVESKVIAKAKAVSRGSAIDNLSNAKGGGDTKLEEIILSAGKVNTTAGQQEQSQTQIKVLEVPLGVFSRTKNVELPVDSELSEEF